MTATISYECGDGSGRFAMEKLMHRLMVQGIALLLWAGPLVLASEDVTFLEMAIQDTRTSDIFAITPVHSLQSQSEKPGVTDNLFDEHDELICGLNDCSNESSPRVILGRCFVESPFAHIVSVENWPSPVAGDEPHLFLSDEKSIYDPTQIVVYLDYDGGRLVVSIDAEPCGAIPLNEAQTCIAVIQLDKHPMATPVASLKTMP